MHPFVKEVLRRAANYLGVREEPPGSNRGKAVEAFLRLVGLAGGNPWCAAFVYSVAHETADFLKVANPVVRTGACVLLDRWSRLKKIKFYEPQVGDIFLLYGSPEGYRRASHTGYVTAVDKVNKTFTTIEGNTNLNGGREGIGVFKHTRTYADHEMRDKARYAFIRVSMVAPDIASGPVPPPAPVPTHYIVGPQWRVFLSGKFIGAAHSLDGRTWFPLWTWSRALGVPVSWDQEHQVVVMQGRETPFDVRKFGGAAGADFTPMVATRQLAKFSGLHIEFDATKREIYITRPKP